MIRRVEFEGTAGALSGRLELPVSGKPVAIGIYAHCFTCSKNVKVARNLSNQLAAMGYGLLSFDFTGLGDSEGEFAATTFQSNIGDLIKAAEFLEKTEGAAPRFLLGHSLGGAAVLRAAKELPSVEAVATIGAPADPVHVTHLFSDKIEDIKKTGQGEVSIAGRPFQIGKDFVEGLEALGSADFLGSLKRPLLIMHSPVDEVVGIDNARQIYSQAKHPKSFISLDGATHMLTKKEDAEFVAAMLTGWLKRYLSTEDENKLQEGVVTASLRMGGGQNKFTTNLTVGTHAMIADEPSSYGGHNLGPTPYDYLLAGLGACTVMTVKMYAELKKIPLVGIQTELRHGKIHAEDCAECETKIGKIDKIERILEFEGDLTAEQIEKLKTIADKCPVHKTLHSEILVETKLKEPVA